MMRDFLAVIGLLTLFMIGLIYFGYLRVEDVARLLLLVQGLRG
jgi:hypothetical protein